MYIIQPRHNPCSLCLVGVEQLPYHYPRICHISPVTHSLYQTHMMIPLGINDILKVLLIVIMLLLDK
jgi:hypothetical protein